MSNNRRGALALVGAGLAIIGVVMALIFVGPPTPKAVADGTPAPCKTYQFFAYNQPEGTHQYRENISLAGSDAEVLARALKVKSQNERCDAVAAASYVAFIDQNTNADQAAMNALAAKYVKDRKAMAADVKKAMAKVDYYTVENVTANYETFGQVVGKKKSERPTIVKVKPGHALGKALVAHLKDGTKRFFRIVCGIQPSAPEFPHVTTTPPKETPPTTPPGTTPPGKHVCPPQWPHGKWPNCKDDPSKQVLNNDKVPAGVRGPGTTPVGTDPGPATQPTDSDTGCNGSCSSSTTTPPPPPPPVVSSPDPVIPKPSPSQSGDPSTTCDANHDGIPDDTCS